MLEPGFIPHRIWRLAFCLQMCLRTYLLEPVICDVKAKAKAMWSMGGVHALLHHVVQVAWSWATLDASQRMGLSIVVEVLVVADGHACRCRCASASHHAA